jgi:transposase
MPRSRPCPAKAWSNGVTEGQIHRLKLVKRQGYGWAGFALRRRRVLTDLHGR